MAAPSIDENALITAARAGDSDAFLQLQRMHLPAVWDFAVRCTLDDDAATEVTREVFVRAGRRISELTANFQFPVLLYGLAVRQLAFREPADASAVADPSRFHAWPVDVLEGRVESQDTGAVWAAMRSYGSDYKALDLYARRGLHIEEIVGALDAGAAAEDDVLQEITWSLATVDAALGPIGRFDLTATKVFAGLQLVEPAPDVAAALWQDLHSSLTPASRGPRVFAVLGIAALGVLATAGSLKAFTGEEQPAASVLSVQEVRSPLAAITTTSSPDSSTTLAPGPPIRVTTSVAAEAQIASTTTLGVPGGPVTTTTRRTTFGPFVPAAVPTTTTQPPPPGGDDPGSTSTTTPPTGTAPGTTGPTTQPPTTKPTTTQPTTTQQPTTTIKPTTTTATTTTQPPTTTTAPPTTTTAPPTTTTAPPTTTTAPPTTTTAPPVTTTTPPETTTTTTTTEPPPTGG